MDTREHLFTNLSKFFPGQVDELEEDCHKVNQRALPQKDLEDNFSAIVDPLLSTKQRQNDTRTLCFVKADLLPQFLPPPPLFPRPGAPS